MKKSGYTIVAAIGILLAVAAIGFGIFSFKKEGTGGGALVSHTLDSPAFDTLSISGIWDAELVLDSALEGPIVTVSLPEGSDITSVKLAGEGRKTSISNNFSMGQAAHLYIQTPQLTAIELDFLGDLGVSGQFKEGLDINTKGTGNFTLKGSANGSLTLKGTWTGDLDFSSFTTDQARVDLDLTGEFRIQALEGINGQVRGLGSVEVLGNPAKNNLITSGLFGD